jgi:hypothetical protein
MITKLKAALSEASRDSRTLDFNSGSKFAKNSKKQRSKGEEKHQEIKVVESFLNQEIDRSG